MKILNRTRRIVGVTVIGLALIAVAVSALGAQGVFGVRDPYPQIMVEGTVKDGEKQTNVDALAPTNCRYGVGYVPAFSSSLEWIPTLHAGWYTNFGADPLGPPAQSADYARVVRIRQDQANGDRLPTYTLTPPLAYTYVDKDGRVTDGLGSLVQKNLGHYWIVGNEMDVDNFAQDNTMPEVYARAYHEVYHYIKQLDPTARVAIGGLSMMTPGRMHYLSIVWDTYHELYGQDIPVDIWNMHLYILEERNPSNPNEYGDGKIALGTDPSLAKLTSYGNAKHCPAPDAPDTPDSDPRLDVHCRAEHDSVRIFREQVYDMRQWMKERGQQNKPLIISEFGLLYPYLEGQADESCGFLQDENQRCYSPNRTTKYLRATVAFMENTRDQNLGYPADDNRLVQQWLWYSIVTDPSWSGGSSNLITTDYDDFAPGDPTALTMMGQAFRQEASSNLGQSNLVGGEASHITGFANQPDNLGSVILTASFRNSGTRSIVSPVEVTFYSDSALTQEIGSVWHDPAEVGAINGCTWEDRNSERVSVRWQNLPVGTHRYWAKIDSAGTIIETSEVDNVTMAGVATVLANGLYVPVVNR